VTWFFGDPDIATNQKPLSNISPKIVWLVGKMVVKVLIAFLSVFSATNALGSGSSGGANWRYFAAGGISAATSHGITTPVDVVKTKMQINPAKYGTSVMKATKMLVEEEGVGFLAQGLAPTVVGYGIEGE
jgi:hypothetical protein